MRKNQIHLHPSFSNFFTDRLLMTREDYIGFLSQLMFSDKESFLVDIPTYQQESLDISSRLSSDQISLTTNFSDTDIPDDSIAFHRIFGTIFAEYDRWGWWFSTKQFMDDIRAAERNPQILAHFIFVNSGGGEAWYLEKAYAAVGELEKPVIVFIEKRCCSAAYYLTCNSDRIFSTSINDTIGSIGTMVAFLDIIPYWESLGAKWIEEYADQSTLKNKKFNDLRDGKPKKYKEKELNPLAQQFINAVRSAREPLAKLSEKHDVFKGETYSGEESGPVGLIDEVADLEYALEYTLKEGKKFRAKKNKQQKIQTYID